MTDEVVILQWWPRRNPLPEGAIEHPPGAYASGHDYWSRLIELPSEDKPSLIEAP